MAINIGRGATTLAALDIVLTWEAFRPVRLSSGPTNPRPDSRS
jgi:hypothetical protein